MIFQNLGSDPVAQYEALLAFGLANGLGLFRLEDAPPYSPQANRGAVEYIWAPSLDEAAEQRRRRTSRLGEPRSERRWIRKEQLAQWNRVQWAYDTHTMNLPRFESLAVALIAALRDNPKCPQQARAEGVSLPQA